MTKSRAKAFSMIAAERLRQDDKFGHERVVPDFHPDLLTRGTTPKELANEYEIPDEKRAKFLCDSHAQRGKCSSMRILIEEVAELTGAWNDPQRLKDELIQVAAVAVFWFEQIEARQERELQAQLAHAVESVRKRGEKLMEDFILGDRPHHFPASQAL